MASSLAPRLGAFAPVDSWAGLRPGSADGLPLLGPLPGWEGVSVATGHYRNGILLSPVTGRLMARSIVDGLDRTRRFAPVSIRPASRVSPTVLTPKRAILFYPRPREPGDAPRLRTSSARQTALMTATASAPAAMTWSTFSSLMPPIATTGTLHGRLHLAQALRARRTRDVLAGRREDGADSDVVRAFALGPSRLVDGVRRYAEQEARGQPRPHRVDGGRSFWPRCAPSAERASARSTWSLTKNSASSLAAEVADGLGLGELLALVAGLVAPLDDAGAAGEGESRHVDGVAAARLLRVDDDVEAADRRFCYGHWSCPSW